MISEAFIANCTSAYFDYYKDLSSNLISSLMEAETAKLDAEYDVRIEAARGNSEEVERLGFTEFLVERFAFLYGFVFRGDNGITGFADSLLLQSAVL